MTPISLPAIAAGLLLPVLAGAQTALPKQSPFAPSGGAQVATAAANESLEFAGVMIGKTTDVIIHDKTAKRKHWIGIGETVDGISVVKYDPAREQAVVRINGAEKVLALKKPNRAGPGPAPVQAVPVGFNVPPPTAAVPPASDPAQIVQKIQPAPPPDTAAPAPTTPQTPQAQAKAETEARMLVSDLLEIGMAQRKAYEDAQRKAAGGGTEQPATVPPGAPGAPVQTPPAGTPATPDRN